MTNPQYFLKSGNINFDTLTRQGTQPTHSVTATSFHIMDTNRQHDTWFKDFHTYYQTNNILKLLILSTISQTYTVAVKDDDTGYRLATTLTILPHLWDLYGEYLIWISNTT